MYREVNNKTMSALYLLVFLALGISCLCHQEDKDLPSLFGDKLNILALGIGLAIVVISSVISVVLCKVADKKK